MLDENKPMKLKVDLKVNLKTKEVQNKVEKANQLGLRDTIVDIHGDTIKNAKSVGFWLTGHNARSIVSEVSGMGTVQQGTDAEPERVVDDSKMEGAVYSTSGYGGYGETGTVKMAARPYFKPALDKNLKNLPKNVKAHL